MKKDIDLNKKPTTKQLEMLKNAEKYSIPTNDFPELTDEQLKQFKKISALNKEQRTKQTVTIRLSPTTLNKAKSLGKGYTSVLSRIIENAFNDDETIKKCL
ncbi:MAG: BrnA antitoxin family protein [Lachnospiraceae bacterium]|jgi:uncharacterized protein (DUF4415 family)|nr:BrnA antitoxin family protein [Lachnospiraceae bacterium]